jgi:hypothetical protein
MFRWIEGISPEQVRHVSERLGTLPAAIPEISRYQHGPDSGINPGNADYVVVADFTSVENYLAYRDHPVHQHIITDVLAPLIASRTAVQYQLD